MKEREERREMRREREKKKRSDNSLKCDKIRPFLPFSIKEKERERTFVYVGLFFYDFFFPYSFSLPSFFSLCFGN